MVEVKCKKCGKKYLVHPCTIRRNKNHFCSVECMKTRVEKNCVECGNKFLTWPSKKFCSRKCYYLSITGKPNGQKGNKYPERSGENSHTWRGDGAGYHAKHKWIYKEKGRAKYHECSLKDKTCRGKTQWTNISGKYKRDISDWQVLCQSHHTRFDMTDEWCRKISKAHIGKPTWMKGKKHSEETKRKISNSKKGKKLINGKYL